MHNLKPMKSHCLTLRGTVRLRETHVTHARGVHHKLHQNKSIKLMIESRGSRSIHLTSARDKCECHATARTWASTTEKELPVSKKYNNYTKTGGLITKKLHVTALKRLCSL
ncbi:hypothetical protein CEXT_694141 [Caerostris extrusa]|uniref:Uncharacterized protein n=1 Tax=Caerostris extrusa TaxID=172846 RepID=A0AAV4XD49_CAEEX|nr:hypothetical protein CEXT_694141 [Caerostris extrusa]